MFSKTSKLHSRDSDRTEEETFRNVQIGIIRRNFPGSRKLITSGVKLICHLHKIARALILVCEINEFKTKMKEFWGSTKTKGKYNLEPVAKCIGKSILNQFLKES